MAASLENVSALGRRLNIELPTKQIDEEIANRLKRLAQNVKMHGFRPGKVPIKVVALQYGDQVRSEVLADALGKSFGAAISEQNLRVAGQPHFEPKPTSDSAPTVEFSATFEIYPEVTIGDISGVVINRPVVAMTSEEIDKTLEIMRKQRTTFEPVERAAMVGDKVTVDFLGTLDGKGFEGGKGEDVAFVLGEGRFLPAFEDQLTGMGKDATKVFEIPFPQDYHGKEIAGKTVTFEVKLKQVAEPKKPALDADFAKSLGVADGDLDKMRNEVGENLNREIERRVKARVKEQVLQVLSDHTQVELPTSLVELELKRIEASTRADLAARGVKTGDVQLPGNLFEQQAQRRVKLGLIFAHLVKTYGLQAKPEQIKATVELQAQGYEQPDQIVKWFYQDPKRLSDIESMVLEENVVAWVLATVKVEDQASAFDELMGNR